MRLAESLAIKHLPAPGSGDLHPVLDLLLRRRAEGSLPGRRDDSETIALAIEGGGLSGAVSAGMCVLLEASGLTQAFDVIYGTSSGALNGSFTAAGQAALGSTNYEDSANRRFANPLRMLRGRPAVDFDFLFDDVIRNRKPYDVSALASGPEFKALGVDLTTRTLSVLAGFEDEEDLMAAVRVSCSLPLLSGPPVIYRGKPMADGGLLQSMPYRAALDGGATKVLVLRSRPASYRKTTYSRAMLGLLRRFGHHPALADLVAARPPLYNAEADELERLSNTQDVLQVCPAEGSVRVSQMERDVQTVRAGLVAGSRAMAEALRLPPIDLYWRPAIYIGSH